MIVLNLSCESEHLFEGWFASASAFDAQCGRGQVTCPVCGSDRITRRPTAPYVSTGMPSRAPQPTDKPQLSPEALATLTAVLRRAGRNSEDVGERFPEEARRIHHGESEARSIKGKASRDDVGELLEEGIMILPLPPAEEDLH